MLAMTSVRILVVEDEAIVALDLRKRLSSLGYEVVDVTAQGEKAVEIARKHRPDLTLMDIRLRGEMDGIKAADIIRTELFLPVVYLTAHADNATVDRARVTEPFGYILKPFDERELRTVIEMALYKHEAEIKLRESERRYATTLASIGDGVIATDKNGAVTFLNKVAEKLTGWSSDDAKGIPLTKVFNICNEDTRLPIINPVARVLAEGVIVGLANHTILIDREGNEVPIDDCASPILDEQGNVTGAVLVFRDVTQTRHIEQHMRHAQKMEAVGQLAGGIAHDFNNMLTVILNYSELLADLAGPDHPWSHFLSEIHQAGKRSADLTSQLLTFCRKQLVEPRAIDLNEAVLKTEKMLQRLIGENIELSVNLSPDLGCVLMDIGQIERILVNLAINARDAMPDQGKLRIETSNITVSSSQFPTLAEGIYRCLTVSDNGHGIPVPYQHRIFEPFFTTKEPGKGTGLGLAAVYGIVKRCRGDIAFDTVVGSGTTFRIYLPAAPEAAPTDQSSARLNLPKGNEIILLVEDEDSVRAVSRHILTSCGYNVLEAENGAQAIQVAQRNVGRIDIVVTDVIMPVMGARVMLNELRKILPNLKVLFLSGYGDESLSSEVVEFAKSMFLQKPYSIAQLTMAVRWVLDGQSGTPQFGFENGGSKGDS
jgi:PAS domain S-box-containing protein